ncbi:MAG: vanadium-dependent haloperoxidase, partial [Verrucomicrobiales bacterium]
SFLSSHWRDVRPFAMRRPSTSALYHDPGLPPQLGGATDAEFKAGNVEVIQLSNLLDPGLGAMINISPSAYGNNTLGQNDGTGHAINPATGAAYPPNVVNHGDLGRVLAEFWADGPESETPPGHWNVLANEVVEHPDFERRWQGTGPIMDELEWDVKMYLALNGAVHDAAIAAWENKREYDYVRPISSIRHMGLRGQFSDPNGPSYHEEGLPLIPGLIEVVTSASFASGERHAHVVSRDGVTSVIGKMAIHCWIGEPDEPTTTFSGVGWILAEDWFPYQRDTFVTPAFAGYVSGHSAFSRAAAEVLTRLTGSAFFPGGMGTFTANKDAYLRFEVGPSQTVQLQWATYYDAADEAGISRLYGGIHVPVDDGPGRIIGSACGIEAWDMASHYFDGTVFTQDFNAAGDLMTEQDFEVTWETVPGVSYQVQTSPDCREYTDVGESIVADGTTESYTISLGATGVDRFFVRVIRNTP